MSFLKNPKTTIVNMEYSTYDKLLKMSKKSESSMSSFIRNLIVNQDKPVVGWETKSRAGNGNNLGVSTTVGLRLGSVTRNKLRSVCRGAPGMKSEAIRRLIVNAWNNNA